MDPSGQDDGSANLRLHQKDLMFAVRIVKSPSCTQDDAIGIGQDDARMMAAMPEQASATTG